MELAKLHNGDNLVSRTIEKVVLRADEIMELLICYQWRNKKEGIKKLARLSHQVQVGLQQAFNRFDEYQFAKYDRDNLEVKLRDALFLVHPKAKDDAQQELFNKIVNKTLQTPTNDAPGAPLADQGQPEAPQAHIPPHPRSRDASNAPSVAAGLACEKQLFSAKFAKKPFDNQ